MIEKKINKYIYNRPDIAVIGNSQTRNSINDTVLGINLSKLLKIWPRWTVNVLEHYWLIEKAHLRNRLFSNQYDK